MRLIGPADQDGGSAAASSQAARPSVGMSSASSPIRYAGIPGQSREASWLDASTLWLAIPHRTQFDGTFFAPTNCGPASLAMVLEAYGLRGYLTDAIRGEVNRISGDSNPDNGTSLSAVAAVAQRAGLYPIGVSDRWTLDDVRANLAQGRPIITLTRYADLPGNGRSDPVTNHYIVLSGLAGDGFIYNDSAYSQGAGRGLLLPAETLLRAWANSAIPGQAVAFALDGNGAGLLSPMALRQHPIDDADEDADDGTPAEEESALAAAEQRAFFWKAAILGITSHSILTTAPSEISAALPPGRSTADSATEPADSPTRFPWLLITLAVPIVAWRIHRRRSRSSVGP